MRTVGIQTAVRSCASSKRGLPPDAHAEPACVTTVANGTIGLVLALQALGLRAATLCMVPAWTFAATAHAIQWAGLVPWIVDVDRESWALDAATAESLLEDAPAPVSAVIPVAPFGHPLDVASWERFRERTGVAVVLDAAAAFDTISASSLPAVVSLHATKVLGTGEGGYVVCNDPAFIEEIQKRANFGFWGSREARTPGLNGKISGVLCRGRIGSARDVALDAGRFHACRSRLSKRSRW